MSMEQTLRDIVQMPRHYSLDEARRVAQVALTENANYHVESGQFLESVESIEAAQNLRPGTLLPWCRALTQAFEQLMEVLLSAEETRMRGGGQAMFAQVDVSEIRRIIGPALSEYGRLADAHTSGE